MQYPSANDSAFAVTSRASVGRPSTSASCSSSYLRIQNPWLSTPSGTLNLLRVFRAPKQVAYLSRTFNHLDHTSPSLSMRLQRSDVTFAVT